MTWDESKHPRDEEGKFTYKDGGTLKGGIEKTEGGIGKISELFHGFNLGEIKDVLLGVITTAAPMALKVGMSIFELKNIIETNNLEKELKEEIKRERIRKDIKKEERERIKRDRLAKLTEKEQTVLSSNSRKSSSISNSISSLRSRRNTSKENPKDILYSESSIQRQQKLKDDEYKNKLLDILGDRATHADVLYGTPKELEEKVKEYGLGEELLNIKKGNVKSNNNNIALGKKDINKIEVVSADNKTIDKSSLVNNSKEYIKPTEKGYITSPYGYRIHPIYKRKILHDGIDIKVPIGTPINAVTSGKITFVGEKTGYGNYIELQYKNSNGDNITTFYAHLNDFKTKDGKTLKVGQTVKKGEQIGHSGNTGIGTGAHLHLGARKNGEKINPIDIIGNVYPKK